MAGSRPAIVVFDRFHVVQHLNRAVDDVRRATWRNLSGLAKTAFKRTRWLWLKNPWTLTRPERPRLSVLCRQTKQPIVRAYYLKEAFQRFWDYPLRIQTVGRIGRCRRDRALADSVRGASHPA